MWYVVVYVLAAYACVAYVAWSWKASCLSESRRRAYPPGRIAAMRARLARGSITLAVLPLLPYFTVELETAAFRTALLPGLKAGVVGVDAVWSPSLVRVLWVTPGRARVYVVNRLPGTPARRRGWVVSLARSRGSWVSTDEPDCVWSDAGNGTLSGNVFPPYPARGDFPAQ